MQLVQPPIERPASLSNTQMSPNSQAEHLQMVPPRSIRMKQFFSPSGGGSKGRNLTLPFFTESQREDLLIDVHFLTENSHRAATG